jgi:Transposase, Mutator family
VFPETREQRCWFHKISNVLAALPKSAHPGAKKALAQIWNAEDKSHARDAVKEFESTYGAKFPKAVAKITDDVEELLAFYDFPAEHWIHLRTTNPMIIWSLRAEEAAELGVCVVDGVFDAERPSVPAVVSTMRSLPNCNGWFGWPATARGRGVGRGRGRVGGATAGSRQRVRGCGGWPVQDVGAGSYR